MSLEFKRPAETKVIIERDASGRERKITATAGGNQRPGHWDIELEHPSGKRWPATFNGSQREVIIAMESMLDSRRNDFRNDDTAPKAINDRIVSVDENPAYVQSYIRR
jgi:hypothetical protein